MKKTLPLLCLLLLQLTLNAQQALTSEQILIQGAELQKEKKYQEAIDLYGQIPFNDPNYYVGLYAAGNCYYLSKQYIKALDICKQGISPNHEKPSFFNLAGNIADDMGNPHQAIAWYDSAITAYPNYISPWLNKATVLFKQNKFREGELVLQNAAMLFPFNSSIHYKLGIAALNQGKLIESFLSLCHSVFSEPQGRNTKNALTILSEMSKTNDDILSYYHNRKNVSSPNYKAVEEIFIARTTAEDSFKADSGIEVPIVRQLQMIIDKLHYSSDDHDFYVQYYLPVLKKILEGNRFEHYCNYFLSGTDEQRTRNYLQKNKKETGEMLSEIMSYYHTLRSSGEIMMSLRSGRVYYHFKNDLLIAKGLYANEKPVGDWEFYYRNGNIKSKGKFDEEGNRTGEWTYFHETTQISGRENFVKGKLHGQDTEYDVNGTVTSASEFSNGQKQGENHDYYPNGNPKSIEVYTDGRENGLLTYYHNSGGIQAEINARNGLWHGESVRYYENGRIESQGGYVEGKEQGPFRFYHENGNLSSEGEYKTGRKSGLWKQWYENGQIKSEIHFENGDLEGECIVYYDNGQLNYKQTYKNGKAEGEVLYFNREGRHESTAKFSNGKLRETKYFDQAGNLIEATEIKNKPAHLITWRIDGTKNSETHYNEKGKADGKELIFWASGNVQSCATYHDGKLDGPFASYYTNGKKEQELTYSDGIRNGSYTRYFKHGKPAIKGWYVHDKKEGQWIIYNENDIAIEKIYYTQGQKNGYRETFYPDGRPEFREQYIMNSLVSSIQFDSSGTIINHISVKQGNGAYVNRNMNCVSFANGSMRNGVLHGSYTTRYFNNNTRTKEYFYHGLADSSYLMFHLNGVPRETGSFFRGEKKGTWTIYNESGSVYSTEEYLNGKLHGKKIYYHTNGRAELEIPYFHGRREGWEHRYNDHGDLMLSIRYLDDLPMEYRYSGTDNQPVKSIPIKGGTGKIRTWYPNGNLSAEFEFSDGEYTGGLTFYHSNGQVALESFADHAMKEGLVKKYFSSGTPAEEQNFHHNQLHGPSREWNGNGQLKEEGTYHLGQRHGDWKFYDQNGVLMEMRSYYYGRLTGIKKG